MAYGTWQTDHLPSAICHCAEGAGAPGRTRTDEYEFTKLALLLLEAQGLSKWRSHVDLHHELPPSQSGVQN